MKRELKQSARARWIAATASCLGIVISAASAANAAGKADLVNSIAESDPSMASAGPPSAGNQAGNGGSGGSNAGSGGSLTPVLMCLPGAGCRMFFIPLR